MAATDESPDAVTPYRYVLGMPIDRMAAAAAAAAPVSVLLSFFYDWGFLAALGLSFAHAPTGFSDHLHSWVLWLPWMTLIILFLVAADVCHFRYSLYRERRSHGVSRKCARRQTARQFGSVAAACAGLIMTLACLFFGEAVPIHFIIFAPAMFWIGFANAIFHHPGMTARYLKPFRNLFLCVPVLMAIFSFLGYWKAVDWLPTTQVRYRIHATHAAGAVEPEDITLFRSFENWLLARDGEHRLIWIRAADVKRMELLD